MKFLDTDEKWILALHILLPFSLVLMLLLPFSWKVSAILVGGLWGVGIAILIYRMMKKKETEVDENG